MSGAALELQIVWFAAGAQLPAAMLALLAVARGRRPGHEVPALVVLALLLHGAAMGLRWGRLGHGPFITQFEVLASNVWSLTLVYGLAYWRIKAIRPSAAVALPLVLLLTAWLLNLDPREGFFPPTYDTPLLYFHLFFGKVFLGSMLVAVALAGVILLRAAGLGGRRFSMPEDGSLVELAYRFMGLALVFDSLMLVAGAIWAQDAWGRFWAWDPLESWAFVTWLLLGFALHFRATFRPSPPVAAGLVCLVFVVAFLTFFGVPFLSTAFHQGVV